jgi:hypothetical protein
MPPAIAPTFTDEVVDVLEVVDELLAVGVLAETDDEGGVVVGATVEITVEMPGVGKEIENSLRDVSHSHGMGITSRILLRRR